MFEGTGILQVMPSLLLCRLLYRDLEVLLSEGRIGTDAVTAGKPKAGKGPYLLCRNVEDESVAAEKTAFRLKPGIRLHFYVSQAPCK